MKPVVAAPRVSSEVSHAWLEHILTVHEARTSPGASVTITLFRISPAAKPGDNVASEVVKIWVEGRVTPPEGQPPFEKRYDLVAKFLEGTEFDRIYQHHTRFDVKELLIYSDVIRDLNAYQEEVTGGKYPLTVPGYVYGVCTDKEWALVMEDVSRKGYKTLDKTLGLDLPHMLLAVDRLARLHAVSHAFNQTHDFLHKYLAFGSDNTVLQSYFPVLVACYEIAVTFAKHKGPDFNPLAVKLTENKDALLAKARHLVFHTGKERDKIQCLIHGDYWTNNLMFRPGESPEGVAATPEDLTIIDWGLVRWSNPLYDLQYLVYSSTTLDMRKAHLREILCRYHDTFTTATQDLGAPVADWGIEELLEEWRRVAIYSFLLGIFSIMVPLSESTKVVFQKGSPSSGWSSKVKTALAKVMVPVMMSPRMQPVMTNVMRSFIKPLLTELLSGENHLLTNRILDLLTEAYEDGVLDP